MSLEDLIKAEAVSLGFVLCGFSRADSPPNYNVYLDWLDSGNHAEMEYMARPNAIEARYHPENLLPNIPQPFAVRSEIGINAAGVFYPVVKLKIFHQNSSFGSN